MYASMVWLFTCYSTAVSLEYDNTGIVWRTKFTIKSYEIDLKPTKSSLGEKTNKQKRKLVYIHIQEMWQPARTIHISLE